MCGISGIIEEKKNTVDEIILRKMNDKVNHRGPDSEGYYYYKNLGLGHKRLSILDLSTLGNQPMSYKDKYVIVYNGEIYNYKELKQELIQKKYKFISNTDTEVILASYMEWGFECLHRFNGMWAFALLDKEKDIVFLSRDRFGEKPLYYKHDSNNFSFGSEIKQLLDDKKNEVNIDILIESMLTYIDNHTEDTYFKGIKSLLPGHYIIYDLTIKQYKKKKYYFLENYIQQQINTSNCINDFENLLKSAISLRMRSDVQVGSCLSGGIDSSLITSYASRFYETNSTNKFLSIHAKSVESNTDESIYAKELESKIDIDLNIIEPSTEDFKNLIDELVYTQEEPFGSPSMFMGYLVFQRAKLLNCKVMLNGQGADEIFLGYERYFSAILYNKSPFQFLLNIIKQSRFSSIPIYKILLYYFYFTYSKIRVLAICYRTYVKRKLIKKCHFESLKKNVSSYRNIQQLQMNEIAITQLPHLLRYEDRNSMRNSIETRLPFLDYRVVEYALSLPIEYKYNNGWTKYILRKLNSNSISHKIAWRRFKLGFNAPEKTWLQAHETNMKNEIIKSEILKKVTDFKKLSKNYHKLSLKDKWMYYNIAVWERIYKVVI